MPTIEIQPGCTGLNVHVFDGILMSFQLIRRQNNTDGGNIPLRQNCKTGTQTVQKQQKVSNS